MHTNMVNDATGILEFFHLRRVPLCSISFSSISFVSLARNLAAAVAAAAALPAVASRASNDASSPPRAQLNRKFGTSARGRCLAATTAQSSAVRSPRGVAPALRAVAFLSSRRGRARFFGHGGVFRVPDQARQRRGCGCSVEPCWACGGFERLCGAPAGGAASPISVAWGGQDPRHHERSVRIRPAPGPRSRAACRGNTSSCREPPASF